MIKSDHIQVADELKFFDHTIVETSVSVLAIQTWKVTILRITIQLGEQWGLLSKRRLYVLYESIDSKCESASDPMPLAVDLQ